MNVTGGIHSNIRNFWIRNNDKLKKQNEFALFCNVFSLIYATSDLAALTCIEGFLVVFLRPYREICVA
jgi:hypothetical protein